MVKSILSFILLISFISCNGQENKNIDMKFQLNNDVLKKQIAEYIEKINSEKSSKDQEKIFIVRTSISNEHIKYDIYHCLDIYCIYYNPVQSVTKINNHNVFISIENLNSVSLDSLSVLKIFKKNFKSQMDYYEEVGDYPPPITARVEQWILTFKGKRFIKKEIINGE